jgi:DNA-binding response OmpR family regulator
LLADDDATASAAVREMLLQNDCACDLVHHGEQAVKAFTARDYDLIMISLRAPLGSGLATATMIRNKERHFPVPRVPMVLLSAGTSDVERKVAKNAGFDEVMHRPADSVELRSLLVKMVKDETRTPPSLIPREPIHYPTLLLVCGKDDAKAQDLLDKFQRKLKEAVADLQSAVAANNLELSRQVAQQLRQLSTQVASGRVQRIALLLTRLSSIMLLHRDGPDLIKDIESASADLAIWRELRLGQCVPKSRPRISPIKTNMIRLSSFLKKRLDIFSKSP